MDKRQQSRALPPAKASCPAWLNREAKAEWQRLAPALERRGCLTALDRAAFTVYCVSYARWRECLAAIETAGPLYMTATGRVAERPEVRLAQQTAQLMQAFAFELGLSPSSRARMSVSDGAPSDDCPRCSMPPDLCGCF